MESRSSRSLVMRTEPCIALALCAAALAAGVLERLVPKQPTFSEIFAPNWIPLTATLFAAAWIVQFNQNPAWIRIRRVFCWGGLLLMVWVANGILFDFLRITRLIPLPVDWPGTARRTLAFAAVVALAHLLLARGAAASASTRPATWYGYAAFAFALPYPVLRVHWAFGGTLGLGWPGAAGKGFAPLLITIPFLLAATLSLLLISPPRWMPRWLLLTAGWSATAIVGTIGPVACWTIIKLLAGGHDPGLRGIAIWIPCLFYGSWFLFAIAIGLATRSYQLRSAVLPR